MTLIERLDTLATLIGSLGDSKAMEAQADGFATRAKEFASADEALAAPARQLGMLTDKGIIVQTPRDAAAVKRAIDTLVERYEGDPRSLLQPDEEWRLTTRPRINRVVAQLNANLLQAWRSYVSGLEPHVDQGFLRAWRRSAQYSASALRIEQLEAERIRLAERLPTTKQEIERPQEVVSSIRELRMGLPLDPPESVSQLFAAIDARSATAAQLTPEALSWLGQHQFLEALTVSWRVG